MVNPLIVRVKVPVTGPHCVRCGEHDGERPRASRYPEIIPVLVLIDKPWGSRLHEARRIMVCIRRPQENGIPVLPGCRVIAGVKSGG